MKLKREIPLGIQTNQPPSGGCVLKPSDQALQRRGYDPAAFGRLCVETMGLKKVSDKSLPAAFGRLCVETTAKAVLPILGLPSRLRAAVC